MSYLYSRHRKEIITINGGFDPCQDPTTMSEAWDMTGGGWYSGMAFGLYWTQVVAPGAIGGYAHKFDGTMHGSIGLWGVQGLSLYRNHGFQYYISPYSPYYWKMKAEFRLRIEEDEAGSAGTINGSLGFWLDGNVKTYFLSQTTNGTGVTIERIGVFFHKENGKVAIAWWSGNIITSEDYAFNYDQYYDIRIEWYFNWYNDPRTIHIDVWIDDVKKIDYDLIWPDNWRTDSSQHFQYHTMMGRCGPAIIIDLGSGGASAYSKVIGYFKDILISQEVKFVNWECEDNILQSGRVSHATLKAISDRSPQFGEGSDLRIWKRDSTSDDWEPRFRGIIREINRPRTRLLEIAAEGYETTLMAEKSENLTHTSKTATYIVQDAINNPDKGEFEVTTYVESTSMTYSRNYPQNSKSEIMEEMGVLEGFVLFLDHNNYWHFQSYRTNQLPIHLIYGESRLLEVNVAQVFIRRPNLIRVIGKGFTAQRELAVGTYASGSSVPRNFNRMDLTSQLEVDEALDFYCSLLNEPIRVIEVIMRINHLIQKGHLIRLTDLNQGIKNQQFLVTSVYSNRRGRMILGLLEAKPHLPALLSDLSKRADSKEGEMFPQDETSANPEFSVEGVATVNITGNYELEFDSTIERSGDMVITDELIDDLLELWNAETVNQPTHLAYGTGTTEPLFSDTTLETETGRAAASVAYAEKIGRTAGTLYRCVEFELDIVNPSGITEIGLFNASSSGTMACRVVIPSYTKTGTVTFRIKIRVEPAPGFCYIAPMGRREIVEWLYGGGTIVAYTHIAHYGFNSLICPLPDSAWRGTQYFIGAAWCPDSASVGTFSKTKLYSRNIIKFQFLYPDYDWENDGNMTTHQNERFLALVRDIGANADRNLLVLSHRGKGGLDAYNGRKCKWIIWLKFISGETEY